MKTIMNRIEKQISLSAQRSRVWRALSDSKEFGEWFGVQLQGGFAPGARVRGRITHPGFEHLPFEMTIERMEPERLLSWRWHPYAIEAGVDYSKEPETVVEFELTETAKGTMVTVVESGFDRIPATRRAKAFEMNDQGWAEQMKRIERHVAKA